MRAAQDLFPGSPAEAEAVKAAWDLIGAPVKAEPAPVPRCDPTFAADYVACEV